MNVIDFIIIIFLLLGVFNGYTKGLIVSLAGLVGNVIGLICAAKYYKDLGTWANTEFSLAIKIQHFLQDNLVLPQAVFQFNLDKTPLPDLIKNLDNISVPDTLKENLAIYIKELQIGMNNISGIKLGEIVHQYLASALVSIIAFVVIWLIIANCIMLVAAVYRGLTKRTILGSLDRLGGAVMGGLVSALIITILIGLISPLLTVSELAKPSLFSAIIKNMGAAKTVPYFTKTFMFLTENILSFWI